MKPISPSDENKSNRMFGKVSFDNPKEGITNLIAALTGRDPSEVKINEDELALVEKQANEIKAIRQWMNPFYGDLTATGDRESKKKRLELINLGKFVYFLNKQSEIKLVSCGERPDFIIQAEGKLTGIEITGIYNEEYVEVLNVFKTIIAKCEDDLKIFYPQITGLFNIVVYPSKIKEIVPFDKNEIVKSICSIISAKYKGETFELPSFIHDINSSSLPRLELVLAENIGYAELSNESLINTIENKEAKIKDYKSNTDINECWLLIVVDGISAISNFKLNPDILPSHLVAFDRIYLFNSFTGEIFEGLRNTKTK